MANKKAVSDEFVASKFMQIKRSAEDRGIPFNMTLRKVRYLLNREKCFFTGALLTNEQNSHRQLTFDRLDNNKGYTDKNVVACTQKFNVIKGSLTPRQIDTIYKALKSKKIL